MIVSTTLLATTVLLMAPRTSVASNMDLFGYGVRGMAMGGAVGASAAGHEAVYYNPSRLAFDTDRTFNLGFQHAALGLEVNGEAWETLNAPALSIGFGIPLPFGAPLQDRFTLGLAFVLPQTSILVADTKQPGELTYVLMENRAQTVSIQAALGIRITDALAIGVGMIALAELDGGIDVGPNAEGNLGSSARTELQARYSAVLGVTARPFRHTDVALTFRQVSRADYQLPIDVELGDSFPIPVPTLDIAGTAQYDPQQVTFAIATRVIPHISLDVAATWKQWSRFENPIRYTAVPENYPEQPDPGFRDRVTLRLGVEVPLELGAWALSPRAGFMYEPSPVPEQTGLHNYLDSDRVVPSIEVGLARGPFQVGAAGQVHLLADREHTKSACVDDPRAGAIVALEDGAQVPTTYPRPNPGCPGVSHGGTILVFGVEAGVRF